VKRSKLRRRYGKTRASIGRGWRHIEPHHKYAIVSLYRKKGGGHLKQRYVVGRGRDAHEALAELFYVRSTPGYNVDYAVLDLGSGKGSLAPIVSEATLRERAARGQ
jgi:hypothetical protein